MGVGRHEIVVGHYVIKPPKSVGALALRPHLWQHAFLMLARDDSKYGYDSDGQNFYLKLYHEFQKMVLISFKDLNKIDIFPKFHRCSSKIVPATPILILKYNRP